MLTSNETGQYFDKFVISLNDGTERTVFFDISSFFGIRSKIRSKEKAERITNTKRDNV